MASKRQRVWGVELGSASWAVVAGVTGFASAGDGGDGAGRVDGADDVVTGVRDVERTAGRDGQRLRAVELGRRCGAVIAGIALRAGSGDEEELATECSLEDLVAIGVGEVEVASGVVGDAGGMQD